MSLPSSRLKSLQTLCRQWAPLFDAKNPFMSPICKSLSAFLPGWFSQGWCRAARWQTSQRAFVPSRFHVKCNNAWGTKTEESDLRCVSARQARQQEHKSTERCERFNYPLLHRVTLAETEQISQPPSLWERWERGLDWTWVVFVLDELWRQGSFSKTAEQEIKCKYHAVIKNQSFICVCWSSKIHSEAVLLLQGERAPLGRTRQNIALG